MHTDLRYVHIRGQVTRNVIHLIRGNILAISVDVSSSLARFASVSHVGVLSISVGIRLVVLQTFMKMIFAVCIHVMCLWWWYSRDVSMWWY